MDGLCPEQAACAGLQHLPSCGLGHRVPQGERCEKALGSVLYNQGFLKQEPAEGAEAVPQLQNPPELRCPEGRGVPPVAMRNVSMHQ